MLMYHGTVEAYLPAIKANGLKPSKSHSWHIRWPDGDSLRDFETVDSVYLTPDPYRAMQYAETKAHYLGLKVGEEFEMFGQPNMRLVKEDDAPVVKTSPVLLTVDIDVAKYKRSMQIDPSDRSALKYRGTIPADAIKEVRQLPVLY